MGCPGGSSLCFEILGDNNTPLCSRWNVTGGGEHLQSLRSTLGGGNCGVEGAGTVIRTRHLPPSSHEQLLSGAIPGFGGDLLPGAAGLAPSRLEAGWRERRGLDAQGRQQCSL